MFLAPPLSPCLSAPPEAWFLCAGPLLPFSNLSVAQVILAFCPSTASLHGPTRARAWLADRQSDLDRIVSLGLWLAMSVDSIRLPLGAAAAANGEAWPSWSLRPLRAGVPSHVYVFVARGTCSRPSVRLSVCPSATLSRPLSLSVTLVSLGVGALFASQASIASPHGK